MISNSIDKDSICSSSSIIIHDNYKKKSSLLSCCRCCCSSRKYSNTQLLLRTVDNTNLNKPKGFLQRIQIFKAHKRKPSVRKQQETTSYDSTISNNQLVIETSRLTNDNEEQDSNTLQSTAVELQDSLSLKYPHRPIYNSQSIPYISQYDVYHNLNNPIDSYSFTDIEVISTNNEEKYVNSSKTSKRFVSNSLSLTTTNLSKYSTQSLLRKLLNKAQVLDEYYNDIVNKTKTQPSHSLSSSINSLLGRSGGMSRPLINRIQSTDSFKRIPRRKFRHLYDTKSMDSSRLDLYVDEDNVLRELIRFNNDIDLILSRLEMEGENLQQPSINHSLLDENIIQQTIINPTDDSIVDVSLQINDQEAVDQKGLLEILTMRTDNNEINIHLLLSNDIDRLRETGKSKNKKRFFSSIAHFLYYLKALSKLRKMAQENCNPNDVYNYETITLAKINKLPKSTTWKGKRVFGVPLRVYQQTTGHVLPMSIVNALQYLRINAGKCDGLFRKPGVKSKIDHLRSQIELKNDSYGEQHAETIKFDDYQPFVVADVIRQYFRELPECIIPPSITSLLCNLLKCITQEEQLLALRLTFLMLPDESREVLETILRFLLDISIRSGNNQINCRNLARIFLPSVFQSFYDMHNKSSKILWWKLRKEKLDTIQQENERLILEHCLMIMILNIDLLCRIPSTLTEELKLPSPRRTKRLDELVTHTCNGEFHLRKYISKNSEEFLQRLSLTKFKNVQTNVEDVNVCMHKPTVTSTSDIDKNNLPIWKCSVDIPNTNVKQVYQRVLYECYLWDNHFAESRTVEKIDDDKEIVQYVVNFLDYIPVRSFCEFRFSKKVTLRSAPDANAIIVGVLSIDHLQNHFLPGGIGINYHKHYYIKPSNVHPNHTTVTQITCVDFGGRSTQWYENVYGSLLAHNLISLRDSFTNARVVRI
ncbi:unnamed protein product [Rotaria magnacalcarata]|uniref:Rho-GAP domain-containing protein n=5 Tax=Rotaria magnacalcarata TaxID=392030 RepID=A0A814HR46_9BILA|nr:unnamed protein product [Rotaria magnacalcarata]CAF3943132.1 unnamed protein product [Rotaria magnacalcarata]